MNTKPTTDELNDEALNDVAGGRKMMIEAANAVSVSSNPMTATIVATTAQPSSILTKVR